MLLILAGVSLNAVFSEKGIVSRAEKAGNKYNETKAREVLETVLLADGQYEKHSNSKYNQDDFLDELIKSQIEGADVKGDVAIIDGWAFLLDRSVPKIGETLGRAEGLIFPTVKVSQAKLAEDYRTASFTVTAIEETNGINKIEIWLNGEKIKDLDKTYCNVKTEITETITVNKNGVYTVKVYGKLMASETVEVTGIVPTVEFTPNGNTDWKREHKTKITVKTNETITSMKYLWTTSGSNEPKPREFTEECINNSTITGGDSTMTGTYYLWVMLTTDSGKTNICGSEGFNFDNEGPTVKLESTPVSETSFTLTATANDEHSGIARYEFYIDGEKREPTTIERGKATYTWNGTEMVEKNCYVIVFDKAENKKRENEVGKTKLHTWEIWDTTEKTYWNYSTTENAGHYPLAVGNANFEMTFYPSIEFDHEKGLFTLTGEPVKTTRSHAGEYKGWYYYANFNTGNNRTNHFQCVGPGGYMGNGSYIYSILGYHLTVFEDGVMLGKGREKLGEIGSTDENKYPKNGAKEDKWYEYVRNTVEIHK